MNEKFLLKNYFLSYLSKQKLCFCDLELILDAILIKEHKTFGQEKLEFLL